MCIRASARGEELLPEVDLTNDLRAGRRCKDIAPGLRTTAARASISADPNIFRVEVVSNGH
ncbi:hypothetical protein [Nocardia niwae]|uniref:hypothetical protein n=1 Tax=Nocardia niwae TaxID=626084 RepID=UPI00340D1382